MSGSAPAAAARIASLQREIRSQTERLAALEARLWKEYPRFMELTQPQPVTAQQLQTRLLRPDEAALILVLLPRETAIFALTRQKFQLMTQPVGRADIATLVARVRATAESSHGDLVQQLRGLDPADLHQLYREVVAPAEGTLRGARRVFVVADGALSSLPLEMLVIQYDESTKARFEAERSGLPLSEFSVLSYLGDRYRFSYLPSLAAFASLRSQSVALAKYTRELVAFADPIFEGAPSAPYSASTRSALTGLTKRGAVSIPRLPETADEVREIAAIVGGRNDLFLRERAQEVTLKGSDLRGTRYVHFATHGLLGGEFLTVTDAMREGAPDAAGRAAKRNIAISAVGSSADVEEAARPAARGGQPALVLTLVGDLRGEDGLLSMNEVIQDVTLDAELVVLSACNTAGETIEALNGEGFAGMTRAFMFAGARGLLVSHWPVESQATKDLMVAFFAERKAGASTVEALQSARRRIAQTGDAGGRRSFSRAHPYFWAPFVHVGD